MLEELEQQFTKYEIARIVGARALQIAMDAPLLLKIGEKELEEINYNPIEIAKRELVAGVLPITINRPLPKKKETKIKKLTSEEVEELRKKEEEHKKEIAIQEEAKRVKKAEVEEAKAKAKLKEGEEVKKETSEDEVEVVEPEKEAVEEDEIMELATPEDEVEETSSSAEDEGV